MAAQGNRWTISVEPISDSDGPSMFGLYHEFDAAQASCDRLLHKLKGTGYTAYVSALSPERSAKQIMMEMGIDPDAPRRAE